MLSLAIIKTCACIRTSNTHVCFQTQTHAQALGETALCLLNQRGYMFAHIAESKICAPRACNILHTRVAYMHMSHTYPRLREETALARATSWLHFDESDICTHTTFMSTQTDRHTDRQTDRKTDRQTPTTTYARRCRLVRRRLVC